MSLSDVVGDLGCWGVDVDAFKASCRVPLYPEQWNRWFLWRTARDNASAADVERSTFAVMRKWFEMVEGPSGLSSPGMSDIWTPSRGKVDNMRISLVPWDWSADWGRVTARAEDCTPTPTPAPGGRLGVAVEFVYRGQPTSMPWPVHSPAIIGRYCPTEADWMLVRAYAPPSSPTPPEKTAAEEAGAALRKAGAALLPNPIGLVVVALAGLGVVAISKALRR
jgi:hypothetical protein